MEITNNITITAGDFKTYFSRDFQYLVIWNEETTYNLNDVVYYNNLFYKSLISNNVGNIPDEEKSKYWELDDTQNINDYVSNTDIEKAFLQAKSNFNINLFVLNKEIDLMKMCFLYLTAHYLIKDLSMSNGGATSTGLMTSKSVGSVSASYSIPEKILKNPLFSYLIDTEYGKKYLMQIYPRLIGNMFCVKGKTTWW